MSPIQLELPDHSEAEQTEHVGIAAPRRNAMQAIALQGTVTVETRADGQFVALTVADTGQGMNPEILRKIFDPFFTTKDVGEGTGLGLSVVHGIVTAHGGTIEAESREGQGTRFTVRLPSADQARSPERDMPR